MYMQYEKCIEMFVNPTFPLVFRGLKDADLLSKSDPMCVLFTKDAKSTQFFEVGQPLNPYSTDSFISGQSISKSMNGRVHCSFEVGQPLNPYRQLYFRSVHIQINEWKSSL